jgi:DMSO reductase iron-sulfur subunit
VTTPVTVELVDRATRDRSRPLEGIEVRGPELLPLEAGQQYRFGFDMAACIGCHSCEVACAEQNGLPLGATWRRVGEIEGGDHPDTRRFHLSMSCNHCLEPACLEGCPTGAYLKLDNGVVEHHADDCIGCQYCTWNCPYSVPVFQPDRRIVTKCDMCQPRLSEGLAPACVGACPTHAITVERVDVAAWRADHTSADAPELPSSDLTLSTTRISLPEGLPERTAAASDWNLRPEHPHWPLVWLTLVSQAAAGVSATATDSGQRLIAAALAIASLAGALLHLGRPAMAWKALRNLRRSWLSREVLAFSLYGAAACATVVWPALAGCAAVIGIVGVYTSARLYVVPGRPAWNTPLTIVRFLATAAAIGPMITGHPRVATIGIVVSLAAIWANWARLARDGRRAWRGAVRLETHRFRRWTVLRHLLAFTALIILCAGGSAAAATVCVVASETIGRWLFYVTVVPLNMPGAFWRGAAGWHR